MWANSPSNAGSRRRGGFAAAALGGLALVACGGPSRAAEAPADPFAESYQQTIRPLLEASCLECHGYGAAEGSVSLDAEESGEAILRDGALWARVLRNVRAGLMPPPGYDRPAAADIEALAVWVKHGVVGIDPGAIDPGPTTLRRLNRLEYRNTVRELLGVEYDVERKFPADDTGDGFDTVGDVLGVSPLLLEKYFLAADEVVSGAIPDGPRTPENADRYDRFFPRPAPPAGEAALSAYRREVIQAFASRAARRPPDPDTVAKLVAVAEAASTGGEGSFERGAGEAARALLASPGFLFHEARADPRDADAPFPLVDEHTLASRLSYFLWAGPPDDRLRGLADAGELRDRLDAEVARMVADARSSESLRSFVWQWLRVRDVMHAPVNRLGVEGLTDRHTQAREDLKKARRTGAASDKLDEVIRTIRGLEALAGSPSYALRDAMRSEAELLLERVVREDRSLLELIDSDYTYLNQSLAEHYGIPGVEGDEMRLVELPADAPRGGVLTLASTLVVTSNPTRTSPVKRGLFVLDNLLGTPPPPPPPDIPSLEEAAADSGEREPTLREMLAAHRDEPLCASCHRRMDPIGFALENFDALGRIRETDRGMPIDTSGELVSGEPFAGVEELKRALAGPRRLDFYRCVTEKLFVYAIGRGVLPEDLHTIDQIVARLDSEDGRFGVLLEGLIDSPQFQRIRPATQSTAAAPRADGPVSR